MDNTDLISFIIPVYNVSLYLDKCLESIVNQTYKNIEVILIDDGSTDISLEKCMEWKNRDKRILVITKQNEGLGITRNLGIKIAKGKYLIFVDSDDYIALELAEKLYSCIKTYNADMAFCDIYNVIEQVKQVMIFNVDIEKTSNFWDNKLLLTEMPVYLWGKIYKKELFLKHELWMTDHYIEDAEFLPKLLSICNSIAQVKEPLYYYINNRPGSIMMSKRKQIIEQLPSIFDNIVDFLNKKGFFEKMKEELELYMVSKYFRLFYQDLSNKIPYFVETELQRKIEDKLEQYFTSNWKKWTKNNHKKFLVWGSPILKANIINYNITSYMLSGNFIIRYHFSSLISAMQKKKQEILNTPTNNIENLYRKHMIDMDIQNHFLLNNTELLQDVDDIIIDFLEERYDIIEYQGNYYTKNSDFDKLQYLNTADYKILKRNCKEVEELWKNSCIKFIEILKKSHIKNVHLIKNYVHENMRDYDCSCTPKEMNVILKKYYTFFEENLK